MSIKSKADAQISRTMSVEDKQQMYSGASTLWNNFVTVTDKFTELIFICSLLGAAVWDLCRMYVFSGTNGSYDIIKTKKYTNTMVTVYYVMLAGILYLSMINHERTLYNFGFLRGSISKAVFLLFCAAIVFPMDGGCNDAKNCTD